MPDRTKNYWIQRAAYFHRHYQQTSLSLRTFVGKFLDKRTSTLLKLMPTSKNTVLLDIGCGSGIHLKVFAPRYKLIVGVDYSQPMLNLAKSELQRLELHNWKLIMADAHTLPLPDKQFDCVIAMGLLDYVSSPAVVLSEVSRVLKTGGVVIATIPKQPSFFFIFAHQTGNYYPQSNL